MNKTYDKIISLTFVGFIAIFFLLSIFMPSKEFSEVENRNLAEKPVFSIESLFSGDFAADYETYITDQFPFRDTFVTIKSYSEMLLGKKENNGIYITDDGYLLQRFDTVDFDRVDKNILAVENFAQSVDIPVYTSLIPTSTYILKDKLPTNAPSYDEKELADYIKSYYDSAIYIDSFESLENHNDEYIYFKTDHHWTALGAYYSYVNLTEAMGREPIELEGETLVSDEFFGTYHSRSGVRYIDSDKVYRYNYPLVTVAIFEGEIPKTASLFDESFLDAKDKYSYFLGGNFPLVKVTNPDGQGNLLIVKDSFSNAQLPYFASEYKNIYMVDLRLNKTILSDYIIENNIDEVLVIYSISNFTTDTNIIFLR